MLYITTRNDTDAHTASWTLRTDRSPDGGLYIPFRLPVYEQSEILLLKDISFGQVVANLLNVFFSCHLTGPDVDLCIGRTAVKLQSMNHRLVVAETWHNPRSSYKFIEQSLFKRLCTELDTKDTPSDWARIAIRVSILFGLFAQMLQKGLTDGMQSVDISVTADDFSVPMAAWYAKQMGLPIGTIVCSCNENSSLWDLIRRGEFNTGNNGRNTDDPQSDITLPVRIERLVYGALGPEGLADYLTICRKGGTFFVPEDKLSTISDTMFAAVVGNNRVDSIIKNVIRTNGYTLDHTTALAFGALQDYRASAGESRTTLLISEVCPEE